MRDRPKQIDVCWLREGRGIELTLHPGPSPLAVEEPDRHPDRYATDPRVRPLVPGDLLPARQQLGERVLRDVTRALPVVQDQVDGPDDGLVLGPEQPCELDVRIGHRPAPVATYGRHCDPSGRLREDHPADAVVGSIDDVKGAVRSECDPRRGVTEGGEPGWPSVARGADDAPARDGGDGPSRGHLTDAEAFLRGDEHVASVVDRDPAREPEPSFLGRASVAAEP